MPRPYRASADLTAVGANRQCLPEIATGAKRPRNDKPLAFTVLSTACISRQHCAGRGQPGPAAHLQSVQAAVKIENAPDLSLRGGRRPTWRPERAARGSALGVQSREGSYVFADDFPVIQLGAARFPRRFAPRNDTSGWCGSGNSALHRIRNPFAASRTGAACRSPTGAIGACRLTASSSDTGP